MKRSTGGFGSQAAATQHTLCDRMIRALDESRTDRYRIMAMRHSDMSLTRHKLESPTKEHSDGGPRSPKNLL